MIVDFCKANLIEPNTVNRDRHTEGPYTNSAKANKAYGKVNGGSYEGYRAALEYGLLFCMRPAQEYFWPRMYRPTRSSVG